MGKTEEDPPWAKFSEHYLPWHGHVTALTVAPQARRMGIARKLSNGLEQACDAQDAWFMDLFVRKSNAAVGMYKGMGYSVYRRVLDYYSDDPTGGGTAEDAYDMRKPLSRDKDRKHVRENGENFTILPEDMWHG